MIEQVERYHCPVCDFSTDVRFYLDRILRNKCCPWCNNSEKKPWLTKYKGTY